MGMSFKKTSLNLLSIFVLLCSLSACKITPLPSTLYNQYSYEKAVSYKNNTLEILLKNPLRCPLRVWFFTSDTATQATFDRILPITLRPTSDTVLTFVHTLRKDTLIRFSSRLGDTSKKIHPIELDLPFPRNKKYSILQENNTNFTHNSDFSRYALDFNLKINDTICSATDGFVVGIVDRYKYSGSGLEWRNFGNYITIYEPISGIFTQYVHLIHNGSFVKIGEQVKRGQAIALSGNTGQSTHEHLHFNCLIPVSNEDGLKSIPIEFMGGIKGINLKKGDILEN